MRGDDRRPDAMFSYVSPEERIPQDHPLRAIRGMVVAVLLAASLLGAGAANASEIGLGLGAFGGGCFAVTLGDTGDDPGDGFIYGARLPVRLVHLLTLEGFYEASTLGSNPSRDLTAFGVNAIIGSLGGAGINFYPYVGIGSYKLEQSGGGSSSTDTGWSFGLGLGLPLPSKLSIQIRAEVDVIVNSDNTSFGLVDAGLNYRFGH